MTLALVTPFLVTLALVTLVLMTLAALVLMTLVAIALISGSCDTVPRDPGSATLIIMAMIGLFVSRYWLMVEVRTSCA